MSDSDSITSDESYASDSASEDGEIERESRDNKKYTRSKPSSHRTESVDYSGKHRTKYSSKRQKDDPDDYSDADDYEDEEQEDELDIKPPQAKSMRSHGSSSSKHGTSRREGKAESRHQQPHRESRHQDRPSTSRHRHNVVRRDDTTEVRRQKKKRSEERPRSSKFPQERERDKPRERSKNTRSWMTLDQREPYYASDEEKKRKDRPGYLSKSRYSRHRGDSQSHSGNVTRKKQKISSPPVVPEKPSSYRSSPTERSHSRTLQSTISSTVKDVSKGSSSVKKINSSIYEVQEVEMSEEERESDAREEQSPEASYPSNDETTETSRTPSSVTPSQDPSDEEMEANDDLSSIASKDDPEDPLDMPPEEPKPETLDKIESIEVEDQEENKELPYYYPAIQGCRSVDEFERLNKIEEGTYGVVYRAEDKRTGAIVALKRVKMEQEKEGFPITSLREINTLLKSQHPNIVSVKEIVVGSNIDSIYIVMEYVEHDLKSLMSSMKRHFSIGEVKTLMVQLLSAVAHLHDNWILHRDLKTSNLLFSHKGILKVGDFGLAREYGSPLKAYTPVVVTLWYRAPELLLQAKEYSCPIDLWSVGCIFGELLTMKPLLPGQSDIDQLQIIFESLGTPSEKIWPGYSDLPMVKKVAFPEYPYNNLQKKLDQGQALSQKGFDLINRFLTYCPEKRITAEEALKHDFFNEAPKPIDPSMFPTWPAKSEQGLSRSSQKSKSPKPPSGGKLFSKQLAADDDEKLVGASGFHLSVPSQGKSAKGQGFSLKF